MIRLHPVAVYLRRMKLHLVSTLWPIDSKCSHIKMVRASVSHLIKILRLALRIARNREPHIRTMCGPVWSSDFERLSLDVLCQKIHSQDLRHLMNHNLAHQRAMYTVIMKIQ